MKNKTELIARVMLVVFLLLSGLNLTGCVKSQLKKGQYYEQSTIKSNLSLRISSYTNEFD